VLERDDLRVVGVLGRELLPDGLHVGIVLAGELLGDDLAAGAAGGFSAQDGPGVPQVGDEEGAGVHDGEQAAGADGGGVRVRVELGGDLRDEGPLRGREGGPDRGLRHAPRARRRVCTGRGVRVRPRLASW
jgi:hypothetical protein